MRKYMVVVMDENGMTFAHFFDSLQLAERNRQDAECGLGWYAEIYKRVPGKGYELLHA